jgi:ParB family chromosome partitioning protein
MAKLDELRRSAMGNIHESMGGKRAAGEGGIPREYAVNGHVGMPAKLRGITRNAHAADIPVDKIQPDPRQPREEFDPESISRLAESLKTRGQLQPIRVRWDEEIERYVIICGERRWRAAMQAGLPTLSCTIMEGEVSPSELMALALIENLLREDLRPIEQAKGFRSLMDSNGWSGNQLAEALGIAQPTVVKALALLKLPATVQEQVEQGTIGPATAYEISRVEDPETQRDLADQVVKEKMSRADAVEAVKKATAKQSRGGKTKSKASKPDRLPAEIKHRGPNGCRVVIATAARHTLADVAADLEAIAARLRAEMAPGGQEAA